MDTIAALRKKLDAAAFRPALAALTACLPEETGEQESRCRRVLDDFAAAFGEDREVLFFSAPGRTEIGGNHTDHQGGIVLAASVNRDILAAASPNGERVVRLLTDDEPLHTISLDSLAPSPADSGTSRALVRGMAARLAEEGFPVGGFDVRMRSTVLRGSGLSSSAAFEVMTGNIMNAFFCAGRVDAVTLAKFGQYAENVFFGKPCGLMDQIASSVGGVNRIDFRNPAEPEVRRVAFDADAFGHALCIVDSGGNHANMSDAYAAIPGEMRRVAELLGCERLAFADRTRFFAELPRLRKEAGDRAVLRAWHFFEETERAAQEASALEEGRFADFLALVRASARSSALHLQNAHLPEAVREQAVDVALAVCGRALEGRGACRVHGGGFAGTVQAFVPLAATERFRAAVDAVLGSGACQVLRIRAVGGTALESSFTSS